MLGFSPAERTLWVQPLEPDPGNTGVGKVPSLKGSKVPPIMKEIKTMKRGTFKNVSEGAISRAILEGFYRDLSDAINADVFVIGAGPAGLVAAYELAKANLKVFVVEQNNYLGGGFWIGGYFMNTVTVRYPANELFDELGIKYTEVEDGLYATYGPLAASKLIYCAAEAGVRFLQLTYLDDLIIKDGRVSGVVVNWSPVRALPRSITCVDPIALESKFVIDASGHDAVAVRKLASRGLVEVKGLGAMNVNASEDAVVEYTSEVYPGLIVAGMAVAETFGLNRMGPTFGGMLLSGRRAARIVIESITVSNVR